MKGCATQAMAYKSLAAHGHKPRTLHPNPILLRSGTTKKRKKEDMLTLSRLTVLLVTPIAFAIPAPRDGERYVWQGVSSDLTLR